MGHCQQTWSCHIYVPSLPSNAAPGVEGGNVSLALHQAKTDNQRTGQSEVSKDQSEAMITVDKGHGGRMAFYGRENSFFLPTEAIFIMLFAFNDGGNLS